MRNICLFLQWLTRNKVCLGYCRKGLCHKTKSKL